MNMVSREQSHELIAKLQTNTNWSVISADLAQRIIMDPKGLGGEFTQFLLNGARVQIGDFFRETGEFTVTIPALSRPTIEELQLEFYWIKSIERDSSPTEAVTLRLGTVLRAGENSINGQEYERRLVSVTGLLGYQQIKWLVDHQDEHPVFKALLGEIYIDGPGLVVVGSDGSRNFPCLSGGGGRWSLYWRWLSHGLGGGGRIAVSGK